MRQLSKTHSALLTMFVVGALFTGACGDDVEGPGGGGRGGAGGRSGGSAGQAGETSLGGAGAAAEEPGGAGAGGQAGDGATGEGAAAGEIGAGGGGTLAPPGPDIPTYANCFSGTPTTHEELINACTDSERVDKSPNLPALPQN